MRGFHAGSSGLHAYRANRHRLVFLHTPRSVSFFCEQHSVIDVAKYDIDSAQYDFSRVNEQAQQHKIYCRMLHELLPELQEIVGDCRKSILMKIDKCYK